MTSIALGHADVIIGVDTHKDQHVAVALDGVGGLLDDPLEVPANNDGYRQLVEWASSLGKVYGFGVEGCGSTVRDSHSSFVVTSWWSARSLDHHARGNDACWARATIDAEHAARQMLAGTGMAR